MSTDRSCFWFFCFHGAGSVAWVLLEQTCKNPVWVVACPWGPRVIPTSCPSLPMPTQFLDPWGHTLCISSSKLNQKPVLLICHLILHFLSQTHLYPCMIVQPTPVLTISSPSLIWQMSIQCLQCPRVLAYSSARRSRISALERLPFWPSLQL